MTAQITEVPGYGYADPVMPAPRGSHRKTLLIVGLVLTALLVLGAVFLFSPFASAAGSCGGG
jgi:hypothetical protein